MNLIDPPSREVAAHRDNAPEHHWTHYVAGDPTEQLLTEILGEGLALEFDVVNGVYWVAARHCAAVPDELA